MSWADDGPPMTVVARCASVVCGPDVAPTATNSESSNPGRLLVLLRRMPE